MGGCPFNVDPKRRGYPTQSCGAYIQFVYSYQQFLFKQGIIHIGVVAVYGAGGGVFGHKGGLFHRPPYPHTHHKGRAGVGARLAHTLQHIIHHTLLAVGGS